METVLKLLGKPLRRLLPLVLIVLVVLAATYSAPLYAEGAANVGVSVGIAVRDNRGFPLIVRVEVSSGNGGLSIVGVRGDSLFRHSLRVAVYEAAWILGLDPWSLNYTVTITPLGEAGVLSGPSLSLAVYVATVSALTGLSLPSYAALTGVANPDSTVGFVGFIEEKARGAEEHNYTLFIYPALQDREYRVVRKSVHLGPYVFSTRGMASERRNFTGINVSMIQAASGPEVLHILANTTLPSTLTVYLTNVSLGGPYWILRDHMGRMEARIMEMLRNAEELRSMGTISARYPQISSIIEKSLEKALAYYGAYRNFSQQGLALAALEYLCESYRYAAYAYYLARFFTLPDTDTLNGIYMDYASKLSLLEKLASDLAERPLSIDQALLLADALRMLEDIGRDSRVVTLGLLAISNGFVNGAAIKASVSRIMAKLMSEACRAQAMLLLAASMEGGATVDFAGLVEDFRTYANLLYSYAREYSSHTRVFSEIVNMAGGHLWLAGKVNGNTTYSQFLRLGHLLESISYSQLYFALHPGVKEAYDVRYEALLKNLALYLQAAGGKPPAAVQWFIERALLYEKNESRIMYLEKALAYLKLYIAATHRVAHVQTSSETATMRSWPVNRGEISIVTLGLALWVLLPLVSIRREGRAS